MKIPTKIYQESFNLEREVILKTFKSPIELNKYIINNVLPNTIIVNRRFIRRINDEYIQITKKLGQCFYLDKSGNLCGCDLGKYILENLKIYELFNRYENAYYNGEVITEDYLFIKTSLSDNALQLH